ncbi:hypothetical protein MPTK1_2g07940 [Marchantia polymorpha subsp. ruderalis]|uniref:Uncharacterized protein n=1 Tax=Marchantia polymorpha TaxID=3197 RepID=A0A2R6XGN3_MARPO|nr:hypothetical protein MARPO_0015s0080 [Marchantia polymorpha]BBN01505.1 hypothetical protein Mp_2g07940 [Marchantia polymorpha subsp. ruderalis]|eukprot:PTQ45273.1 hypothetical protein MARPO_0015s0080 [Marchantia polymorpha]
MKRIHLHASNARSKAPSLVVTCDSQREVMSGQHISDILNVDNTYVVEFPRNSPSRSQYRKSSCTRQAGRGNILVICTRTTNPRVQ